MKWGNDEPREGWSLARLKSKVVDVISISHKRADVQMPVWTSCPGCRHRQHEFCLAPFEPQLILSGSGRLILCLDRQPWGDLVLRQAEQVAKEAWNVSRS